MAMPIGHYREGKIGVPFPDMLAKVVGIGTTEEVPCNEEGEICIHEPALETTSPLHSRAKFRLRSAENRRGPATEAGTSRTV